MTSVASENGKKVLTMAEYIEREATVKLLRSLGSRDYRREKGTIQEAIKMVSFPEYTPSADVAPVRHGRWIHTDLAAHWLGKDECSECTYHEKDRSDLSHFNYCPNCGATMDGGDGNSAICSKTT